jgi:hypothetical protein
MTPRIQLTSAPYALSLIGTTNQFPSSGQVIADSAKVTWGVSARGGNPVNANGRHQGYTFSGNNGDTDSGLGSTANGQVSMFVNNTKMLTATPDSVAIRSDLRFNAGGNINYNGLSDWRLVEEDNFQTDNEDWKTYAPKNANEFNGWNNLNTPPPVICPTSGDATQFIGKYLIPAGNNLTLKKYYDLTNVGPYSQIKVKFKYYFLDTWNPVDDDGGQQNANDVGYAAFATSEDGNQFRIGWIEHAWSITNYVASMNSATFQAVNKWGGTAASTDFMKNGEMTAYRNGTDPGFWVMFGTGLNDVVGDERWGVGMIEIWVK